MQQLLKILLDQHISDQQNNFFEYCLALRLVNDQYIYLTTANNHLKIDNILYRADSGFKIVHINSDEGGRDAVKLKIACSYLKSSDDIINAEVRLSIFFMQTQSIYHYYSLTVTNIYRVGDGWLIIDAQPISMKLQQNLLNVYSKTCRAALGDKQCTIDTKIYSQIVEIVAINGRELTTKHITQNSGYFSAGRIILPSFEKLQTASDNQTSPETLMTNNQHNKNYITILKQLDNILLLEKTLPIQYKDLKTTEIVAGCDKKFSTCCSKYDNAINFRGEPFIPGNKILV